VLLEAVFTRSEGNPFFAEELVAAAHGDSEGLPATLRDMLLARIGALHDRAQAVVRVAAAGGRQVHHQLLATAAALPEPGLSEALRAAVRHHVLVALDDGFGFRHALVREAAYAAAEPARAALLHQRRGQYLWWAGGGHGTWRTTSAPSSSSPPSRLRPSWPERSRRSG
jgi:predicted ATPase